MANLVGTLIRTAGRAVDRSLRRPPDFGGGEEKPDKDEVGRCGERLAARYLWFEGMKVLYRNYRAPKGGEVDIVLRDGAVLVFAEVKTRTSTAWGRPADAVGQEKQRLITRGGLSWLRLLDNPEIRFRFDVVEVVLEPGRAPAINHIRGAFSLPEDLSVF